MKGPGEREIETDRRMIRGRISKLKADLKRSTSKWPRSGETEAHWFVWL